MTKSSHASLHKPDSATTWINRRERGGRLISAFCHIPLVWHALFIFVGSYLLELGPSTTSTVWRLLVAVAPRHRRDARLVSVDNIAAVVCGVTVMA